MKSTMEAVDNVRSNSGMALETNDHDSIKNQNLQNFSACTACQKDTANSLASQSHPRAKTMDSKHMQICNGVGTADNDCRPHAAGANVATVAQSTITSPSSSAASAGSGSSKKKSVAKLMRTPTATPRKKERYHPDDGKRLDEELEELDAHLMGTTLKNVKYMHGAKFTVFNEIAFQRECLEIHNKIRQSYGCPPLVWCQELADEAEAWARVLAERGRVLYKELPGIGENISLMNANSSDHLLTGAEITRVWADERQFFNYAKPGWNPKCQNFTQMIWKRSTEVGVARVWLPSTSMEAVVAFYKPSGNCNSLGEFRDNVPRPLDDRQPLPSILKKH